MENWGGANRNDDDEEEEEDDNNMVELVRLVNKRCFGTLEHVEHDTVGTYV